MSPHEILQTTSAVLVIDWPSREVPETLARAGMDVTVKSGPGPQDFSAFELRNGNVVPRPLGRPPQRADLIYVYRPLTELPGILSLARTLGAKAIWMQSGLSTEGVNDTAGCWISEQDRRAAENLIEDAGLSYVCQPYIAGVARSLIGRTVA